MSPYDGRSLATLSLPPSLYSPSLWLVKNLIFGSYFLEKVWSSELQIADCVVPYAYGPVPRLANGVWSMRPEWIMTAAVFLHIWPKSFPPAASGGAQLGFEPMPRVAPHHYDATRAGPRGQWGWVTCVRCPVWRHGGDWGDVGPELVELERVLV